MINYQTTNLVQEMPSFVHESANDFYSHDLIMAEGSPLEHALRLAQVAARSQCPVFIRGESGTGKEVMAHYLHSQSSRSQKPFVAVNCAAIPESLIESELFGHRKGAFTGAISDHLGKFRLAEGGTLFLDEIGDMPLEIQTRLLRVLQEKTVSPVGDNREYKVDFRLICATHRDLRAEVRAGRFRQDLFFRLDVVEIALPPLRQRSQDIPVLLEHFLTRQLPAEKVCQALKNFPPSLLQYAFPGNIRELKNWVERFLVMSELGWGWSEVVNVDENINLICDYQTLTNTLPTPVHTSLIAKSAHARTTDDDTRFRNSRVSDSEIYHALNECGHHRAKASNLLGISRRALQYRLAKMVA